MTETKTEWRPTLPASLETIPKAETLPLYRHRWNTNEEIASILISFERHESWMYKEVRIRPRSGSMLLYSRKRVRYRRDGYCWKKRKDGKTTREDHMKLKVQGTECIYGCYVHSAVLPTFHRRCYWLLQNPDIVLVHYLNVPSNDDTKPPVLAIPAIPGQKEWTREELTAQLTPMFDNESGSDTNGDGSNGQTLETSVDLIVQQLIERTKLQATEEEQAPKKSPTVPRAPSAKALKATKSTSTGPSPKKLDEKRKTIGTNTGGVLLTGPLGETSKPLVLNLSQIQGAGGLLILNSMLPHPPSEPDLNPMDFIDHDLSTPDDEVFSLATFDDMLSDLPALDELASNSSSLSGYASLLSPEPVVKITDYCPDWSPTQGGNKILIIGPWYSSGYGILIDGNSVPTSLVQSGVLRCYTPEHDMGLVPLQVTCDGRVISNTVTIEYRNPPVHAWFDIDESGLKFSLLEKMESLDDIKEETLDQKVFEKLDAFEDRLLKLCRLGSKSLKSLNTSANVTGLSVLHLAAALGYTRLLSALLQWRKEDSSLEQELDPCGLDRKDCTPLMWACARGHKEAAILLYNAYPETLQMTNQLGDLPMDIARLRGHHHLADILNIKLEPQDEGFDVKPALQSFEDSNLDDDLKEFTLNRISLSDDLAGFDRFQDEQILPDSPPLTDSAIESKPIVQDFSRLTVSSSEDKKEGILINGLEELAKSKQNQDIISILPRIPRAKITPRKPIFSKKNSRQSKAWMLSTTDSAQLKIRKREAQIGTEEGVSAAKIGHLSYRRSHV